MHRKIYILLVVLLSLLNTAYAGTVDYGLTFYSHDVDQEDRTSLHLSPVSHFNMKKGFTLSFDMKLYELHANYGYVFRIISGGGSALDMVCNLQRDRFSFILSNNHDVSEKIRITDAPDILTGKWFHVDVIISESGEIQCSLEGSTYRLSQRLLSLNDIDIRFGWSDHPVFYTTDVAPMSIRNVRIKEADKIKCEWPLFRHNEVEVYDTIDNRVAAVKDGKWIADSHFNWKKCLSMKTSAGDPKIAYDTRTSRLYVATMDSVHVCSLETGKLFSVKVDSGTPIWDSGNQMIYDPLSDKLVCYSMHSDRTAEYDFRTNKWKGSFREEWPPISGHSRYYDADSSRLYTFGGYGDHMYRADFTCMDLVTGERISTDMSQTARPRYFSAMGLDANGDVIVMGGFGNESGYQEESPEILTDIIRIDKETLSGTRIGSFDYGDEPLVFGSTLLCDGGGSRIYAQVFNNTRYKTSLTLVSYDYKDGPGLTPYAEPIEYRFRDTDSWSSLVFSSDSTCMYSIVLASAGRGVNEVNVYSLAYPPLKKSDVLQPVPTRPPYYLICIAVLLAIISIVVSFLIKYLRRRYIWNVLTADRRPQFNISLLGGFQVLGINREDITSRFTSVPRQIMMYFLLRYVSSNKAVTSAELDEKFWYGMERSQIINNRNVNIRKLRVILKNIGDIQLLYNNDMWSISLGQDVLCDYFMILPLLRKVSSSDSISINEISLILSYAKNGPLLMGYEYPWLDKYKAAYSDLLISVMMKIARHPYISSEPKLLIQVADCILLEDPIDEFAVRTKCRILYRMGQKGKSKQVYDQYVSDYRLLLDSEPEATYQHLLGNSN